jgi:hypothetical protein
MVMRIKEVRPRDDEFTPGQPVRLLVGYMAWAHHDGADRGCGFWAPEQGAPQETRYLATGESLTFLRYRADKAGSCVVRDARGTVYACPVGFLADAGAE